MTTQREDLKINPLASSTTDFELAIVRNGFGKNDASNYLVCIAEICEPMGENEGTIIPNVLTDILVKGITIERFNVLNEYAPDYTRASLNLMQTNTKKLHVEIAQGGISGRGFLIVFMQAALIKMGL